MKPAWIIAGAAGIYLLTRPQQSGGDVTPTDSNTDEMTGDPVTDIARAIAHAEGFYVSGSFPSRNNNPGDITDSTTGVKKTFTTVDEGWVALKHQVSLILTGASHVYKPEMPIIQIASIYTLGKPDIATPDVMGWANTVAGDLGLSITDPLTAYGGAT